MHGYDGNTHATLRSGECCMVRKNHLARYNKQKEDDQFEKVIVIFDEVFLNQFQEKHKVLISQRCYRNCGSRGFDVLNHAY